MRFSGKLTLLILGAVVWATDTRSESAGQWESGEKIYQDICGHCHEIGVAVPIRGRNLDVAFVSTYVRSGLLAMPAFKPSELSDQELRELVEFLNSSPSAS